VVDDTGFPKDGVDSPYVARQYSGTLGKAGNCQIGVSVQMVTDTASLAANWRLFCPASWDDTTVTDPAKAAGVHGRRADAGIPEQARHREKWRLASAGKASPRLTTGRSEDGRRQSQTPAPSRRIASPSGLRRGTAEL
jgi:DDE superfamily endonuclease